jgi:hypothetical protein
MKSTTHALEEAYAALDAIDRLAGDDFCENLDMRAAFDKPPLSPDLMLAQQKLSTIYQIAHSESPNHSCYGVHDSWRKIKEVILSNEP